MGIMENKPDTIPQPTQRESLTDAERNLYSIDALKEWRKTKGKEASVESDVVLPRDFVERIAAENPESMEKLHQLMARIPWRYQHYSKEIFSVLRKQEVV